jgi:hypothetical protein
VRFVEEAVEMANDRQMIRKFRSWLRDQGTPPHPAGRGKRKKQK